MYCANKTFRFFVRLNNNVFEISQWQTVLLLLRAMLCICIQMSSDGFGTVCFLLRYLIIKFFLAHSHRTLPHWCVYIKTPINTLQCILFKSGYFLFRSSVFKTYAHNVQTRVVWYVCAFSIQTRLFKLYSKHSCHHQCALGEKEEKTTKWPGSLTSLSLRKKTCNWHETNHLVSCYWACF